MAKELDPKEIVTFKELPMSEVISVHSTHKSLGWERNHYQRRDS